MPTPWDNPTQVLTMQMSLTESRTTHVTTGTMSCDRTPESTAECLILEDQFLSGLKRVIVIRTSPQASEKFDFYPDIGSGLQKNQKIFSICSFFALRANSQLTLQLLEICKSQKGLWRQQIPTPHNEGLRVWCVPKLCRKDMFIDLHGNIRDSHDIRRYSVSRFCQRGWKRTHYFQQLYPALARKQYHTDFQRYRRQP